jgi:5-methylcytosine-specific restriction enzyme subunit McrC
MVVKSTIPIENIYYLFCYAWDRFSEGRAIEVGGTASPEIMDLFACVLVRGLNRLFRRGLDRDYVEQQSDSSTIRGRILLHETLRRNLLYYGRATCRFDELQRDVLHNRIIKATLRTLANLERLDAELRHQLHAQCSALDEVSNIRISRSHFLRLQINRNNAHYDLLLKICELTHSLLLPAEGGTGKTFYDILDDEQRMATIFELFVRNFLRAEQSVFSVRSELIAWKATMTDPVHEKFLPVMRTDIVLRSTSRIIVVDTKYYRETLARHMGQEKIWSTHLYQLYAYLKNLRVQEDRHAAIEGMLLYPSVGHELDLKYLIDGHPVRIRTINLDRHWSAIHEQLLGLLN